MAACIKLELDLEGQNVFLSAHCSLELGGLFSSVEYTTIIICKSGDFKKKRNNFPGCLHSQSYLNIGNASNQNSIDDDIGERAVPLMRFISCGERLLASVLRLVGSASAVMRGGSSGDFCLACS
jgi:hypothetical protein